MALATSPSSVDRVRQQYEDYPYPLRNPADEHTRLVLTGLDDLALVNHFGFRGRKDWTSRARILVAGGGTGDGLVYLAHQVRKARCEIVYLDLSAAALSVAQQRIRARGLQDKVMWLQGSITDVDQYGLGKFDYINCSGVLHHLPDPKAGLRALRSLLKDDGVMGLMVYGLYGRTGVYQLQDLCRRLNSDTPDATEKLHRLKALLNSLPPTNWYRHGQDLFHPLSKMDDHEMYDLFLHSQDRAYSVPQLYEWLASAKLHLVEFTAEQRLWYDPAFAFRDADLLQHVEQLPRAEQQAICEVMWGNLNKHIFWAAAKTDTVARSDDAEMVPQFTALADGLNIAQSYLSTTGEYWSVDFARGTAKIQLKLNVDPVTRRIFALIDGRRDLADIADTLHREAHGTLDRLHDELREVLRLLSAHDLVALRHKSVPALPR
jgi:SAM-dependent methyltransferase